MFYGIIVCRTLTRAQRTVSVLERSGISAFIVRTPKMLTRSGCGYSVKIAQRHLSAAKEILLGTDLAPLGIYLSSGNGQFQEADL